MKIYVKSSRYNSEPSSLSKFEGFDKQKYFKLYSDLFHTITDGMNADLPNNIKEAFKKVGGRCRIEYVSPTYVKFDGVVDNGYTVGGSISTQYLEGDSRRLAEDLAMASFRTSEGKDVPCNTYEFVDWVLASTNIKPRNVMASGKLLKIKRRSGNIDTYEYKREDGQGSVYEPADSDNWFQSYIVTPEGKLLSWTTQGKYYPSNNEFWIEDDTVEGCGNINASSYIDNGAFGAIGEVYTKEELKAMFNNLCAEGDPVCNTYDSFESWFEDTLESGLIQDADLDASTVHRLAPDNYDAITSALEAAGCWYKYDEDFDRILVLPDGLDALDAAGVEYTEV